MKQPKICRYFDHIEDSFENPIDQQVSGEDLCPNFWGGRVDFIMDKFGEWFWKFNDRGWEGVYFPLDRLPLDVEKQVRDKLKEK